MTLLLINSWLQISSVCLSPTLLLSVKHPDTIHFFWHYPQVYQTNTMSIACSSCTSHVLPSAEHKPQLPATMQSCSTSFSHPWSTLQAAEQGCSLTAIPDFHVWRDEAASQEEGSCQRMAQPSSGTLRYLQILDRYQKMVDSWTAMLCITHQLLGLRAWPSCTERVCVCMFGEWSYFRWLTSTGLQIRDQGKNNVLQFWAYFTQIKCMRKHSSKQKPHPILYSNSVSLS